MDGPDSTRRSIKEQIGDQIRKAREEKGYSQKELTDILDLGKDAVSRWERGIVEIPAGKLYQIAEALDKEISYFYPKPTDKEMKNTKDDEDHPLREDIWKMVTRLSRKDRKWLGRKLIDDL